uniref:Uncharacterized protein n=1 Tax=Opuntia streptacantha TaxID=393608 RepID=A0A7C9DPS8_OPUST
MGVLSLKAWILQPKVMVLSLMMVLSTMVRHGHLIIMTKQMLLLITLMPAVNTCKMITRMKAHLRLVSLIHTTDLRMLLHFCWVVGVSYQVRMHGLGLIIGNTENQGLLRLLLLKMMNCHLQLRDQKLGKHLKQTSISQSLWTKTCLIFLHLLRIPNLCCFLQKKCLAPISSQRIAIINPRISSNYFFFQMLCALGREEEEWQIVARGKVQMILMDHFLHGTTKVITVHKRTMGLLTVMLRNIKCWCPSLVR